MALQVLTANRLADGDVVYLADGDVWSETIRAARVARDTDEAALLEAAGERSVANQTIVAPYLIDVAEDGAGPTPVRYREMIRARGPSVRADLGKQASEG